ncbi:hypothetical protein TNCV_4270131 [Trichonephila clavipes]|nr:hypothetical protein TNCV_4270131 [Trichonephila clavipes]
MAKDVVSRSFEHHKVTARLGSVPPQLRENTLEMVRSLIPLFPPSLSPTSHENLWLDGYLECSRAVKTVNVERDIQDDSETNEIFRQRD